MKTHSQRRYLSPFLSVGDLTNLSGNCQIFVILYNDAFNDSSNKWETYFEALHKIDLLRLPMFEL